MRSGRWPQREPADEWYVDAAHAMSALASGASVPVGVIILFLELLPIRVAVITEINGHAARRDTGGASGAMFFGGLVICDGHAQFLLARELAPAASEAVPWPPAARPLRSAQVSSGMRRF